MPRYAAIDIGSNSVRMLVADAVPNGETRVLAADREVTRLGASVFLNGRISEEAIEEISAVLARFSRSIRDFDVAGMRAVATSAVRDASNQSVFLERASQAIGAPVETISGLEEARLIHLGVMARWPHPTERVLIVDIGGGSGEIIFSDHGTRREAFSKPLGALRLTEVFLASDPPREVELHRLEQYIIEKLEPCVARIGQRVFDRTIGTSATASALVCAVHRIPRGRRDEADRMSATLPQMRKLYKQLKSRSLEERRGMTGFGPRRAEIIVAGAAVFLKLMETFELQSFYHCAAGVRDGIIADLALRRVGRERSLLDRERRRMLEQMAKRYGVSVPHARQVASLANCLFEVLHPLHHLQPECGALLEASAYLHDVGHYISDSAHHKHSAYIVANSGMPGFTDAERHLIALLCRFHRKTMPASRHENFHTLSDEDKHRLMMLIPLLRLADSLDRSHSQQVESIECEWKQGAVALLVKAHADADLDLWAAERVADIFRQVYGRTLQLISAKS